MQQEAARLDELKAALKENYRVFQTEVKALIDALATETAAVQGEIVQLHLDMLGQSQKKLRQFKGRAVMLQIASLNDAVHIFLTGPSTQVHRSVEVPRALPRPHGLRRVECRCPRRLSGSGETQGAL